MTRPGRLLSLTLSLPLLAGVSAEAAHAQYYRWGDAAPRYVRPFDPDEERAPPYADTTPPGWRQSDRGYGAVPNDPRYGWRGPATPGQPQSHAEPDWRRRQLGQGPAPKLMDGGPRPPIAPMPPQLVPFTGKYAPGTIVIETHGRHLLLVTHRRSALRYPISVGRQGFTWTGTEKISRIAEWPDWHPPAEMRKRDPALPEKMTGGIGNPLGAKALYLGNSLYRIHGTNDARTVGHASSSGCFRMLNGHVVDLAARVAVGTPVVVVDRLPRGTIETAQAAPERRLAPGYPGASPYQAEPSYAPRYHDPRYEPDPRFTDHYPRWRF